MPRHSYSSFGRHSYPNAGSMGETVVVNIVSSGSDSPEFIQVGENIDINEAVFINTDSKAYKASALDLSSFLGIGLTKTSGSINEVIPIYTKQGTVIDGFSDLDTGKRYFLSESHGKFSKVPPSNKNSIVYQIGVAKSSTELILYPKEIMIL